MGEARNVEVFRDEHSDEMRVVCVDQHDGATYVHEQTDGAYTLMAFGSVSRRQSISLPSYQANKIAQVIGQKRDENQTLRIADSLRQFFARGMFLSDLLDVLDKEGVAYSYAAATGAGAAFRGANL